MKYEIKIYSPQLTNNKFRFTLGTQGEKTLFVIGLNPSTADDHKPDTTIKKVMRFAEKAKYENFVMFNLYPQRTPFPTELDQTLNEKLHKENILQIVGEIGKHSKPNILAAWGGSINIRPYFIRCLKDIYEATKPFQVKWIRIGGKDLVEKIHPRHPSRASYSRGFESFDIKKYLLQVL